MADSGGPVEQPVTGGDVPDEFKDPNTPPDVIVRHQARAPETDPLLGLPLDRGDAPPGRHRLVVLGDSLTHGYQSNAIFNMNGTGTSLNAIADFYTNLTNTGYFKNIDVANAQDNNGNYSFSLRAEFAPPKPAPTGQAAPGATAGGN